MKTMKDYCPKPSDAIQATVDGLRNIPNGDFKVDMRSYGRSAELRSEKGKFGPYVCFGCAATCAVQQATGVRFTVVNIYRSQQARAIDCDDNDLMEFESAIDGLRSGRLEELLDYYGVDEKEVVFATTELNLYMDSHNYKEGLPSLENLAKMLRAIGL